MFSIVPKAEKLSAYTPIEGTYRVRLDANESFLLPTDPDRERMAQAVWDTAINRYPDSLATAPCQAFAALYHIDPDFVTAGNGSDELISIILSVLAQKGDKVLTLSPDFSMYSFYTAITEADCITLPKDETLRVPVQTVIDTIRRENIRLFLFSNPCNPTSLGLDKESVRRILTETEALVVLDEAYMDFWTQSLLAEAADYENLIVLRTCSKALGMAALRMGFAVANKRLTAILRAAKSPYNVNAVTQAMTTIVLQNPAYQENYLPLLLASREMLVAGLRKIPSLQVYDSCTNFAYVHTLQARKLYAFLGDRGIAVRLWGEEYLRITAGTQAENQELIAVMDFYFTHEKRDTL